MDVKLQKLILQEIHLYIMLQHMVILKQLYSLMEKGQILRLKTKEVFILEIAVMKGHLGCAYELEEDEPNQQEDSQDEEQRFEFQFQQDTLYFLLTNIRGTPEYFNMIRYVCEKYTEDIFYKQKTTNNGYLHLVCLNGQEQYEKIRKYETNFSSEQIKQEFQYIQGELISYFLSKGLDGLSQNRKKQSPLKMCIQNGNLIGFYKLLNGKIQFDLESSSGISIMHCLCNLACLGYDQMQFVHKKLCQSEVNDLKINLKKTDINGFDFILYLVKNFTQNAKPHFKKTVKNHLQNRVEHKKAQVDAFEEFQKYEGKFMELIKYLVSMGCDINGQVIDKRTETSEQFKKWGIQHFLMKFPSLKLIKFFKTNKIRDFNAQNNQNRTPLHLFCMNIVEGNILDATIDMPKEYQSDAILQYFLQNGMNPNASDINRSLPVLYAAINHQYSFISLLRKFKSQINVCNSKNQVPLIEILKNSRHFNLEQIEQLMKTGADPNYQDLDKRNALHHLVYYSTNFDSSPEVCKLLFDHGVKVNALDKYKRSPIFYCFTKIDPQNNEQSEKYQPNDKVEILQVLLNHKDINLNLQDAFQRTLFHYACERNYFFSILYLLDKNINIESVDHEKNTPLGVCLKHRNLDQAALIIKKGIKYGFVHDGGEKQSYFAYAMNHLSVGICFMLLDYGYPIQKALEEVNNEEAFKQILIQKYIK